MYLLLRVCTSGRQCTCMFVGSCLATYMYMYIGDGGGSSYRVMLKLA